MKNLFKLFGIIALVAIIGISFAACDNGTTDDGGKTAYFHTYQQSLINEHFIDVRSTDDDTMAAIESLTKEDIVFTPADVATIDSIGRVPAGLSLTISVLKSGTVTVSIKDKNGVKFVKDAASDQMTFTKE